jgi:hypothetical protein
MGSQLADLFDGQCSSDDCKHYHASTSTKALINRDGRWLANLNGKSVAFCASESAPER